MSNVAQWGSRSSPKKKVLMVKNWFLHLLWWSFSFKGRLKAWSVRILRNIKLIREKKTLQIIWLFYNVKMALSKLWLIILLNKLSKLLHKSNNNQGFKNDTSRHRSESLLCDKYLYFQFATIFFLSPIYYQFNPENLIFAYNNIISRECNCSN